MPSRKGDFVDQPEKQRLTVTVEEASAALGISRSRTYEVIRRGEIPTIRLGGRLLVPWAELTGLVERRRSGSPDHPEQPLGVDRE
jgi:excisionase family DNA binding protein